MRGEGGDAAEVRVLDLFLDVVAHLDVVAFVQRIHQAHLAVRGFHHHVVGDHRSLDLLREVTSRTVKPVVASGGISNLDVIAALRELVADARRRRGDWDSPHRLARWARTRRSERGNR